MMNNGDFTEFLTALGAFESGIDTTQPQTSSWMQYLRVFDSQYGNVDPASVDIGNPQDLINLQYHVFNSIGFMGKYQFGEPLLIDLGYYVPAATGFYGTTASNEWQGTWTGKNDVYSKADFMTNVQELAIREAFSMNMGIINDYLAQAGKTIDDYLGQEFTYTRLGEAHVATVTISGILASAHLQGPGGVAQLFLNNIASSDEYGTNILFYMDKYSDYSTPFGAQGNDDLSGSDYSETFMGGDGHNTYQTGDGFDKIIITNNAGNSDVIQDFNINKDVISLSQFPGLTFKDLNVVNVDGHAQINFPNGQTISLLNVTADQIGAEQLVYGPYKIAWNANSGDTIIDNYNTKYDVIDLNYAFASSNLNLYEEQGSTVIDVVGNNQRIILQGIALSDLSAASFIKAPVDFATNVFGAEASHTPPVETTPPASSDQPNNESTPDTNTQQGHQGGDVFTYTWNWGSNNVIQNFDVAKDQIDLKNFWTSYDQMNLHNNANGSAVIDLTAINNQTITIEGVSVSDLNVGNFIGVSGTLSIDPSNNTPPVVVDPAVDVPPPEPTPDPVITNPAPDNTSGNSDPSSGHDYSYNWSWGANNVIDDFDVTSDVINLQAFWTSFDEISIHDDAQGNAVIDLTGLNNQTITLQGVSSANLSSENITGVTGSFSNAVVGAQADSTPVIDTSNNTTPDPGSTSPALNVAIHYMNDNSLIGADHVQDVFNFTWGWGSNKVITGFNPAEDKVDLKQFWINSDQVDIHNDAEGNAVIDLTALNNQTITLLGVSAEHLNNDNVLL